MFLLFTTKISLLQKQDLINIQRNLKQLCLFHDVCSEDLTSDIITFPDTIFELYITDRRNDTIPLSFISNFTNLHMMNGINFKSLTPYKILILYR
jgi:hypothetical protein